MDCVERPSEAMTEAETRHEVFQLTKQVWNVDTGDCIHVLHGHYHQIYSCAFDGERIITGSLDSTVRVWSAATGYVLSQSLRLPSS